MKLYGSRRLLGAGANNLNVEWALDHVPLPFVRVTRLGEVLEVGVGVGAGDMDPVLCLWLLIARPK